MILRLHRCNAVMPAAELQFNFPDSRVHSLLTPQIQSDPGAMQLICRYRKARSLTDLLIFEPF